METMTADDIIKRIYDSRIIPHRIRTMRDGIDVMTVEDITQDILVICITKKDKLLEVYEKDGMPGVFGYVVEIIRLEVMRTKSNAYKQYIDGRVSLAESLGEHPESDFRMEDELEDMLARLDVMDSYVLRTYLECGCDIKEMSDAMESTPRMCELVIHTIFKKLKK